MGKCKICRVEVLDVTERCPLCQTILEPTEELENMYPNIRLQYRRRLLACRIYLFCALVVQAILIVVDYLTPSPFHWSFIAGLALLLGYICLRLGVSDKAGYRSKLLLITLTVIGCIYGIDAIIGYQGWSLDYVLPAGLMGVDFVILILMMCNRRNWQSYIMWQILMILLSLIPVVLYLTGMERNALMAFLPLGISALLFLGTVMIGGRRAATELARRFHVK
ncbi:MAG: zinc ribbon domain-containing protein [Ruminococcaceae bacterium]|nr:zinc ribbon domain-containing protein [Oscillospiraceae bacterium]